MWTSDACIYTGSRLASNQSARFLFIDYYAADQGGGLDDLQGQKDSQNPIMWSRGDPVHAHLPFGPLT